MSSDTAGRVAFAVLTLALSFTGGYLGVLAATSNNAPARITDSGPTRSAENDQPLKGTGAAGCSGKSETLWKEHVYDEHAFEACRYKDLNGDGVDEVFSSLLGTPAWGGSGGISYAVLDGVTREVVFNPFSWSSHVFLGEPRLGGYRDLYVSNRDYSQDGFVAEWTRVEAVYAVSADAPFSTTAVESAGLERFDLD